MKQKSLFGIFLGIIFIAILCLAEKLFTGKLNPYPKLSLTTPALLFPAISLLLLAYTS